MFDYKGWVERAQKFVTEVAPQAPHDECRACANIAPPLTELQLQQLQTKTGQPLPLELQRFWLTASQHCDCSYYLEIIEDKRYYGGAAFINALTLAQEISNCHDWADGLDDDPEMQAFWLQSIPFLAMDNGDYLGLYTSVSQDNPPVVYLSHDDESSIIAESFTSFLENWEQLCYLGPEIWMIDDYRNSSGFLESNSRHAQALRDFFAAKKPIQSTFSPHELAELCMRRLKQICLIAIMYAQDNDEQLPDAQQWQDEFKRYPTYYERLLHCPATETGGGYAMNANLSGVLSDEIKNPEKTVLFFESNLNAPNPHGTFEAFPSNSRHSRGKFAVGFANGDVRWVTEQECESLQWTAY